MITCKNCNKEITDRIILNCCCGTFCSIHCCNKYHKKTDKEKLILDLKKIGE